ncbi:MAG: hypothetical protein Q4G22_13605 [Paracoccus sp. (in: a-proteobacteria)]|uniref:hypothetical protein n=1 Tax=Paracoccus sp. TaxID=267 RepID=UPI0026E0B7ED|nr:hypothetical protein [Paracoccus sp. (in: a-proteobacteria)]MDO5632854.1 hypothetical protein [Paracoccus sp. (in: a-proteobacteria)]
MQRIDSQQTNKMVAAGIGLAVWFALTVVGDLHWLAGLFLGLVAAGLCYALAVWLGGDDQPEYDPGMSDMPPVAAPVRFAAPEPVVVPEPKAPARRELPVEVADVATGKAVSESTAQPVPPAPAPAALMAVPDPVQSAPSIPEAFDAQPVKVKKPKKDKDDKKKSKSKKAKKDKAAKDEKPTKAKKAKKKRLPDDLKQIKGVGPKLENLLNDHGVTRFEQIAGWDAAEIDRFAALIGRMGARIRADDWVGQARVLATGAQTEFSQRVEAGEVYE